MSRSVPPTSRKVLAHIANRMRAGFTGEIVLQCKDGGITDCRINEPLDIRRLPDRGVDTPE